jgi:hypothetical protein
MKQECRGSFPILVKVLADINRSQPINWCTTGPQMKPLFDSEYFSFIGSNDDRILVQCRKCSLEAVIELKVPNSGNATLLAMCSRCGVVR